MAGLPRSGENILKMKKNQVMEKSGNFILSQENLEKNEKGQGISKFSKKVVVGEPEIQKLEKSGRKVAEF